MRELDPCNLRDEANPSPSRWLVAGGQITSKVALLNNTYYRTPCAGAWLSFNRSEWVAHRGKP